MTNEKRRFNIGLRCHACGVETDQKCRGFDVVNPGGRVAVMVHLYDQCWNRYQEVKTQE